MPSTVAFETRRSEVSSDAPDDHFYKDDLRWVATIALLNKTTVFTTTYLRIYNCLWSYLYTFTLFNVMTICHCPRSGAFKIVSGGQRPMAYQVTLSNNCVSWRYPHPRAITRLVTFPLPAQVSRSCVKSNSINCFTYIERSICMTNTFNFSYRNQKFFACLNCSTLCWTDGRHTRTSTFPWESPLRPSSMRRHRVRTYFYLNN